MSVFHSTPVASTAQRRRLHALIDEAWRRARRRRTLLVAMAFVLAGLAVGFFLSGGGSSGGPAARGAGGGADHTPLAAPSRDSYVRFAKLPRGFPFRGPLPRDVRDGSRRVGRLSGITIYAAPTRDGYWEMFSGRHGGWFGGGISWRVAESARARAALRQMDPRAAAQARATMRIGAGFHSDDHGVILAVSGSTRATPGAHLFVAYADGSVSPIKLIWVSRPIQAGFYYKVIPRSHRTQPHRAIAVELVRGTRIIARQTFRIPRA